VRKIKDIKLKVLTTVCIVFIVLAALSFIRRKLVNFSIQAKTDNSTFVYRRSAPATADRTTRRPRRDSRVTNTTAEKKSIVSMIFDYIQQIATSLGAIASFIMVIKEKKKIKRRRA